MRIGDQNKRVEEKEPTPCGSVVFDIFAFSVQCIEQFLREINISYEKTFYSLTNALFYAIFFHLHEACGVVQEN